jgi:hypothetical protein
MTSFLNIKTLFICSFLGSFISLSQIPDYFENNPSCFNYKSVYKRGKKSLAGYPYFESFDVHANIFIRQSGKALFYYDQNDNIDSLYIDYNAQIGDTLQGELGITFLNDSIQKIDSIIINGTYRHVFYMDTILGPVIIEGIGHQSEIDQSIGEFLLPVGPGIGFGYSIYCYGQNDVPLWDSGGNGGNCNLDVGIDEENISSIKIYPNPASNFIHIELENTNTALVSIFDTRGKQVLSTSKNKMDVSQLNPGLYIVEVYQDNNSFQSKLIIE